LNGIPAIRALQNETPAGLAKRAQVNLSSFLKYNDLSISDRIIPGEFYYLKKKNTGSPSQQHIASSGENLWAVSQKYGVQLKRLRKFNPGITTLQAGTLVWVTNPASIDSTLPSKVIELDSRQTFTWSANASNLEPLVQIELVQPTPTVETLAETNIEQQSVGFLPNQHIVSPGETLYSIAKRYGVAVMDIVQWNGLNLEEGIKPGQILKLESMPKEVVESSEKYVIYEVKATDTLYSVAREHGVTIKQLMDWNEKKDFAITAGEKLRILRQ
jgi:membrane-bound lytic murein transglycosylase D